MEQILRLQIIRQITTLILVIGVYSDIDRRNICLCFQAHDNIQKHNEIDLEG